MLTNCQTCEKPFQIKPSRLASGRGKYCSRACTPNPLKLSEGQRHSRWPESHQVERACETCQTLFTTSKSAVEIYGGKYCSRSCASKAKTGINARAFKHGRSKDADYLVERAEARRAREVSAEGNFDNGDLNLLMRAQGGVCVYCRRAIGNGKGRVKFTVDHKTPLIRGGTNWPSNLQLLCSKCNRAKWTKTHGEYLAILVGQMFQRDAA